MIFVHLSRSWPDVLAGHRTAADVTLGEWALVADRAITEYGDAICGVYEGSVVTAFDITGHDRTAEGRVRFTGTPSSTWSHLIGDASPVTWVRGAARPVRYLDTAALRQGNVDAEDLGDGLRRAVIGDWTLTVAEDGTATLVSPPGGEIVLINRAA